ncbi:MAG: hypothetical protein HN396_16855 [Gemmatimonadales bacterium]|nr:hypothetical protein [Gemmatimonadales bacterium]
MATYQTDSPVVKAAFGAYVGYMQGANSIANMVDDLSGITLSPRMFGRTAMIAHQILKGERVEITDGSVPDGFPSFTYQAVAAAGTVLSLCGFSENEIHESGRAFAETDIVMLTTDMVSMIETVNHCLALGEMVTTFLDKPQMSLELEECRFGEITAKEAEAREAKEREAAEDDPHLDAFMDIVANRGEMTDTA